MINFKSVQMFPYNIPLNPHKSPKKTKPSIDLGAKARYTWTPSLQCNPPPNHRWPRALRILMRTWIKRGYTHQQLIY